MSAAETWCAIAVVLAVASAVLHVIPSPPLSLLARAARALGVLAVGAVAVGLFIVFP